GMPVAGIAADAWARMAIPLVEPDPERHMKRPVPEPDEIVVELLDPRLVADGGGGVPRARPGLGGIGAAPPVRLVQRLRAGVVGLELVVRERPRGRQAARVAQRSEVLLAQAEERRAVELRIAADPVIRVRVQRLAVRIEPLLPRVVLRIDVDG